MVEVQIFWSAECQVLVQNEERSRVLIERFAELMMLERLRAAGMWELHDAHEAA